MHVNSVLLHLRFMDHGWSLWSKSYFTPVLAEHCGSVLLCWSWRDKYFILHLHVVCCRNVSEQLLYVVLVLHRVCDVSPITKKKNKKKNPERSVTYLVAQCIKLLFVCWPLVVIINICSWCRPVDHVRLSALTVPRSVHVPTVPPRHRTFVRMRLVSTSIVHMQGFGGEAVEKRTESETGHGVRGHSTDNRDFIKDESETFL